MASGQTVGAASNFEQVAAVLQRAVESVPVHALQGIGSRLFVLLAVLAIAWRGVEIILQGGVLTQVMGNLLRSLVFIGMAYWFLGAGMESSPLITGIASLTREVAGAILAGDGTSAGNPELDGDYGRLVISSIAALFQKIEALATAIQDLITPRIASGRLGASFELVGRVLANFVPIAFLGLTVIIVLISLVFYFVMVLVSLLMMQIAILVAPVFIPWLVLEATSWLFDSWLRFFIVACMYKVAGAAVLLMGNTVFAESLKFLPKADMELGQATTLAILTASLAATLAYMMMQVPTIAQALISGGGSISLRGLMTSLQSAQGRTPGIATQSIGKSLQGPARAAGAWTGPTRNAGMRQPPPPPGPGRSGGAIRAIQTAGQRIEELGKRMMPRDRK